MDTITDAMALVGQHGVYCQSQRWPGKPVMDIQIIMKSLTDAKELIQSVMEELKKAADCATGYGFTVTITTPCERTGRGKLSGKLAQIFVLPQVAHGSAHVLG